MRCVNTLKSLFLAGILVISGLLGPATTVANAAAPGGSFNSTFYTYNGSTPLANVTPGTVLKSRTFSFWSWSDWQNLTVDQLLYRSTGVLGQPTVNVTSVVHPTGQTNTKTRALSLQAAYDSLNPADEPSVALAAGNTQPIGASISAWLSSGVTVIIPDTEGQKADMVEGNEYGINTLDSIRAATNSSLTGLSKSTPVALMGYSGGAWATEWAAQLAPTYAPDVNKQLIGAAVGGLPVDAAHIEAYLNASNGSSIFSSEIPASLIGLSRAYNFNFSPYLSAQGLSMYNGLQHSTLGQAIMTYWHVDLAEMTKPAYVNPNSIPGYTSIINRENLGLIRPATIPLYIMQGGTGWPEGANDNVAGIGNGDGATVTGDVRTLARQACSAGTPVQYVEQISSDHLFTALLWSSPATSWINNRFSGATAPNNCASIATGNSLAAEVSTVR